MATTINTNMQVYDAERRSATVETLMQETAVFNQGSNGAITLVQNSEIGHYRKSSLMLQQLHVGRRTTTSVADKTPTNMQMGEIVSPKLHRSYMPETTYDAYRKIGADMGQFASDFGVQLAKEKAAGFLNSAILIARTQLAGVAALNTVGAAMNHTALVQAMSKMGDAGQQIAAWVMHSAAYYKLMENAIADNVYQVAGVTIASGNVATFNRPVIVTDSPALADPANPGNYVTMGLKRGAISVLETEPDFVVDEPVTGQDNLIYRIQGEYAYNVETPGFSYLTATGTNPDDAALAVSANYQQVMTDRKSLGGVLLSTPV